MTDLSKTIAKLSPEKRQLLEKVLRRQGVDLSRSLILTRERSPQGDPLSYAQQRLWFLDRMTPGSSFYNVSQAMRLRGVIDPAALSRTFVEIVRRHEMLRTHFGIHQGEPVQLVAPAPESVLAEVDLRVLPSAPRKAEMLRLTQHLASRPFDLASGPLFRVVSMRLEVDERVVFLGMHHIVSDGWSTEVLIKEIVTLYAAFAAGRPSPLPELPIQYADFAIWQRQGLQGELLERQLAYWRQQLSGVAVLDLLTDRPRPPVQTFAGASTALEVAGEELTRELQAIARRCGATLFMTTLAACQALLGRYSGQNDITVGTPISGRNQVQLEGLIGFFINNLVLRTDLGGAPDFLTLLERVREVTLAAYAHQDVPFEKLVGHLHPERDQSRAPLFQVMFGLQVATAAPAAMPGILLEPLELGVEGSKFDITLGLQEGGGRILCMSEYNRDLFDVTTIERLLRHFGVLLQQIATDPARPVAELSLLSAVERQELLAEWNDSGAGEVLFLHELVAEWAARTPEAVAVEHAGQRLSYGDLDRRANQLARHLAALGVGRGVPVGICVERSLDMVVGLLGVLKAGGCYLPLDPGYPEERLAFMAEDCGLLVQLTQESLEGVLPQSWGFTVRLDADGEQIVGESAEPMALRLDADDLAYVIYTSGSTGRPKGVMVPHRGLGNLAREQAALFGVEAGSQVLQFASLSFDASISEIAMALASGATLHLADREALLPGPGLLGLLRDLRISTVTLPPAVLAGLPPSDLPDLHTLVVAGEACPPEVARRWGKGRRLINAYGPTEATVCATSALLTGDLSGLSRLPIGRPIGGAEVYLLDRALNPVPPGVKGELYLGGLGLARGYWDRAALTAAAFVPHPFGEEPGGRLYRTGDLGRQLADGAIELLGRADSQVKLRGFRIELGEIEAALTQLPAVREAVVLLREDHPGERRIVAYVVPQHEGIAAEELRGALEAQLPAYMVPAFFILLEALPRLPNDKIDRRSLPAPEGRPAAEEAGFVGPRTPEEEVLAAVWCQVLRLEKVGVHQNFFEIGGDSILGVQVISRAGQAGLHLTPGQLFGHPTIAGLAAVAERVEEAASTDRGPVTGPVPLTPIQHWFFDQDLPHPEHFNQSLLFTTGMPVDAALLSQAVEFLLWTHDALRMRFTPPAADGGAWGQRGEAPGASSPMTLTDLSAVPPELLSAAIETAAADLQASLDLVAGPLLRVALLRAAAGPDRLFLVVHHLVVDGVSWRILLEDLETVYGQLSRGEKPALPAKTTSFQSWAERLADLARASELTAEAAYWLRPAGLEVGSVPVDFKAGENTVSSARSVVVALDPEETRALLQEVPKVYRTQINDLLVAALAEAMAPWVGRRRVLVDLEGHGREEIGADVDVSRTVGYFTSIFPVLVDLEGITSPGEALKAVKEQMRGIPRRGFGYGPLRYLGADDVRAALAGLPRAGLVFNYFGQLDQVVAGSSLFQSAKESSGPDRNPSQPRPYLLEVSSSVHRGRLHVAWLYSASLHRHETIEALGNRFTAALRRLIEHCLTPGAGGYTPSDFPLARLDQPRLDRLATVLGGVIEDLYPLSPMQQGMLFQTLQAPDSGVYIGQLGLDLSMSLNLVAFERAWSKLIQRHPILRTAFCWRGLDSPLQAVLPRVGLSWERRDLRQLPEPEQRLFVEKLLQEDRRRGFDLSAPPLLRLALIRLGEESYRLVFSSHHLIFDGWSWGILLQELFAFYEAELRGAEADLGAAGSFRDYIAWLQAQEMTEAESYWRRALAGFTAPTELSPGGPVRRLALQASERPFRKVTTQLSRATTEALRSFARLQQVTLNTLVQAAWSLLLHRYSGEDDVLFGAVTAGRSAPVSGIETMVGLLINTLPVRARIDHRAELSGWLKDYQERQAEARRFEHSALYEIHGWSGVPRSKPLFETLLTFENYPVDDSVQEQIGKNLQPSQVEFTDQTNYPLTVIAGARAGLDLEILFDVLRFDAVDAGRMLQSLESMFEGMLASPAGTIGQLPWLAPGERHQALMEWSTPQAAVARNEPFLRLFADQVERRPDAQAVTFEGSALTYRELDSRASQLARYLRRHQVGPGVPVGICVERSLYMIVGVLGILKAGGGYVPLDPTYPAERLAYMMADCGVLVILTQESLKEALPRSAGRTILLDTHWDMIAEESGEPGDFSAQPDDLAYIVYTSGSTGRPKGVMVPHRGLGNLARAQAGFFGVGPDSHVLQFASLSFDASVSEIVMTLSAGATLHLASRESLLPGPDLLRFLRQLGITTVTLPPAVLPGLPTEGLEQLRTLIVAGEACDFAVARRWSAGRRLVNAYGPTEATVCVTATDSVEGLDRLPIGRPIAGMEIYLLDRELQPVSIGVRAEIYVGGLGLARGYWGRPDLTAAAFLPHPFAAEPGARLYRTGDLGLYLPGGAIDFLGRADSQIKLRGFRIELEEIEAALRSCQGVRDAAVTVRKNPDGDILGAWIVAEEGDVSPAADDLRQVLRGKLPEHMVPAFFTLLERMPLSPSGKLDRKALNQSTGARSLSEAAHEAPRTPAEELIAGLFAEVLKVDRAGVDDSFFDRGGHSLLATQVISRIGMVFGVELPVQAIFDAPTARGLAAALEAAKGTAGKMRAPAMVPVPREDAQPLSFSQQRLWFLDQLDPGRTTYSLPAALRLEGALDVAALQAALSDVVRRHEALRTTFQNVEGEPVQVIQRSQPVPLPVIELQGLPAASLEEERWRQMRRERERPFDLGEGPLFRVLLLRLGDREHVVLLTMHHIVSDGWSMGLMVRELSELYGAFSRREVSPLPELRIQYADYAAWQRRWLSGEVLEAELGYWRERLGDRPAALELPTDRPRPAVQTFAGGIEVLPIRPETLAGLRVFSRAQGTTLFMTLLAAFDVLLQRYSGQDDFLVGTPIAGRNRMEIEGLIGFFINMLVLRADLGGEPTVAEILGRVRKTTLSAYAHQDLPFEKLVEELQPERDLSRSPLFQVTFGLQNAPAGELAVPGLVFRQEALGGAVTAKFDLSMAFSESGSSLVGTVEYNLALFERSTVLRMIRHLTALAERLPGSAGRRASELPLLSPAEMHQLLAEWNDTAATVHYSSLVAAFDAWADRSPDAVAVVYGDLTLSYGELGRRADSLARQLRGLGVGPDVPVGLYLERSAELVVAFLAVLKAGGACLPLDPAYPEKRIEHMLADSGLLGLLIQERLASSLPPFAGFVLRLDAGEMGLETPSDGLSVAPPDPDDLAYVIYTSGSTGQSKGVMVPHRGLANLAGAQARLFGLGPGDHVLQFSSLSFDAAAWEIAMALSSGAALCLADRQEILPGPGLVRLLRDLEVTVVTLPPSALAVLPEEDLPALGTLVVAGEACPPELARRWGQGRQIVNGYGPTEASVCASAAAFDGESGRLTLGRPLGNVRVHVVDPEARPVPMGAVGELCIAGAGLARGYLGRPDLTAAAFVPDPFGAPGARLYHTGDLARRLPGGELDFLGRADFQVKVRGFRIELGEIEAALAEYPGIRLATVLAREDQPGDKRLTAYVVATGEPPVTTELRQFLAAKLPEHMVPAAFVFLETLPLTPNGKVDRRALPAPGRTAEELAEMVPARDWLELELIGIWQQVLGTQPIGIRDSFFQRGGHSLLAVRLIAFIRRRFEWEVPLTVLFQDATVEGLARALRDRSVSAAAESPLVTLRATGDLPALYFVHPAGGGLGSYRRLVEHLGPAHPAYGFRAKGLATAEEPLAMVEEMAHSYIAFLRRSQPRGPYHLAGVSLGAVIAFEMARKIREEGAEVARLIMIDPPAPSRAPAAEISEQDEVMILTLFASDVGLAVDPEQLRTFGENERLAHLVHQAIDAGLLPAGTDIETGVEFLRRSVRVFKAGVRAGELYVPGTYFGRMDLLCAAEMPNGDAKPLGDGGWSRLCLKPVTVHPIPGNHNTVLNEPHVRTVADLLHGFFT